MRRSIQENVVNIASLWCLRYTILGPMLHFGTFSKNYREETEELRYRTGMKAIYAKRRQIIEQAFGLCKEIQALRYAV